MTLRNHSSVRTLFLSLLLAIPFMGVACWEPELKDAEIGCGVDAGANPKCPNRPQDAGSATTGGAGATTDGAGGGAGATADGAGGGAGATADGAGGGAGATTGGAGANG